MGIIALSTDTQLQVGKHLHLSSNWTYSQTPGQGFLSIW